MLHIIEDDRYLKYDTPLIDYIREKYLYNNENLIYTKKYSDGTFSITNPTKSYKNCEFINGYPHFSIPLDICLEEIDFFLSNQSMYKNNIYIRYGDTHPHKCIPKLAQVRNLIVENSLSNMIGPNSKSFYGLGDISLKSLNDFVEKYNINYNPTELFVKIVNNDIPSEIMENYREYDLEALKNISTFLKTIKLIPKQFIIESELYKDQNLYKTIKSNPQFKNELNDSGEIKYSLQELMFMNSILKNSDDVLINIIGANQGEHVIKVNELVKGNFNIRNRFLTYEICRNADERNIEIWSQKLREFIEKNDLKIDYTDLLRIIMIINSNDVIIDYNKLDKYKNNILKYRDVFNSIETLDDKTIIDNENDLINKMSLVCYNLNRSIEMGNQNNFYKYIINIVNEYDNNKEKYKCIEGLYKEFLIKCFDRLGYNGNMKKELIK